MWAATVKVAASAGQAEDREEGLAPKVGFGSYAESVRQFQLRAAPWGFDQRFLLANAESVRRGFTNPFSVHGPLFGISVTQGVALGWNYQTLSAFDLKPCIGLDDFLFKAVFGVPKKLLPKPAASIIIGLNPTRFQ
jgi:hypothetical protein